MLLAIDVGNTHTVIGLYQGETLQQHWRLETHKTRTADELGIMLLELFRVAKVSVPIEGIVVCNVVPPLQHALQRMGERYFAQEVLFVDHQTDCGITICLDNPQELGADRIANAVAARSYTKGLAVIVVDFGTATTFDAIDASGNYLGGAIAPGILTSHEALSEKASRLPRTDIRRPEQVIGTNTQTSMQAGIYYGYVGLVDGIVTRMKQEIPAAKKIIATGGLAGLISQETKTIHEVIPNLTLDGLKLIWTRVSARRGK